MVKSCGFPDTSFAWFLWMNVRYSSRRHFLDLEYLTRNCNIQTSRVPKLLYINCMTCESNINELDQIPSRQSEVKQGFLYLGAIIPIALSSIQQSMVPCTLSRHCVPTTATAAPLRQAWLHFYLFLTIVHQAAGSKAGASWDASLEVLRSISRCFLFNFYDWVRSIRVE